MNNSQRPRRHLIVIATLLLTALAVGMAYAGQTDWIFCNNFESSGSSCSAPDGSLWDSMNWNKGTWQ